MRLLILGCSATKRPDAELLPAILRYDGPAVRTLRRWQRDHPDQTGTLDLLFLSAQFGLIGGDTPIPFYDHRMTASRAVWLRSQVRSRLVRQLATRAYTSTFINLGTDYLPALPPDPDSMPRLGQVCYAIGGIGARLGQLKRWLDASAPR